MSRLLEDALERRTGREYSVDVDHVEGIDGGRGLLW